MKILFISESDLSGGASIAAYRLFLALKENGADVKMLVKEKKSNCNEVVPVVKSKIDAYKAKGKLYFEKLKLLPKIVAYKDLFYFSSGEYGWDISQHPLVKEADIIHFHWINHAFLSLKNLQQLIVTGKPIISHLHDMWAFTGGCNYAGICTNFTNTCGNCMILKNAGENDLSSIIYQKKKQLYNTPNISFITSSVSLHDTAKSSSLLGNKKVTAIPIPINKKQFYSIEKSIARKKLKINSDKKIILFGVHNIAEKRKGFQYFLDAINQLWASNEQFRNTTEVALFGKSKDNIQEQFKIKVHILGTLNAQQIFNAYNAADVYVLPSLEDNLPNTILESLACETPVVAFKTGGIPEMIAHKQNGFLAEYKSSESLAEGIDWVLSNNINATISDIYGSDYAVQKTIAYYHTLLNK